MDAADETRRSEPTDPKSSFHWRVGPLPQLRARRPEVELINAVVALTAATVPVHCQRGRPGAYVACLARRSGLMLLSQDGTSFVAAKSRCTETSVVGGASCYVHPDGWMRGTL
jgi:hypothetical protein